MSDNVVEIPEHKGRRVLIVDDNVDTLEILDILLRRLGCTVVRAMDGEQAMTAFVRNTPDLVVLDVNMPKQNGFDVCREIRTKTRGSWVPVVMLTAMNDDASREEGLVAGADEYFTKPFDPEDVLGRIESLLRRRRAQESAAAVADVVEARAESRPDRKEVTVLFADIRNFTSIADQLEPEEVADVLSRYLGEMADVVFQNGGVVNKVMGDGLLVLFNDPIEQPDHVERAVHTAIAMQQRARVLQAQLHSTLPEPFEIGIGLHRGIAVVGKIGSGRLSDYTAVGAVVNIAARLQALATKNEIVASHAVYSGMTSMLQVRNERRETLRGFAHPIRIAEIAGLTAPSRSAARVAG